MKNPYLLSLSLPLILAWGPVATVAAEPERDGAQTLMPQHCVQCHGTEVYTRKDRKVTSLEGLGRQVRRCEIALELRWFDEDLQAVTDHLNDQFYRFKP